MATTTAPGSRFRAATSGSSVDAAADAGKVRGADKARVGAERSQLYPCSRPETAARQVPGEGLAGRFQEKVAG